MSNVGTAKKFDIIGLFRAFMQPDEEFENNEEIDENIIDKINVENVNVTQEQIEELKKSQGRLEKFAEKYDIEPKDLKVKRAPKAKKARLENKTINIDNSKIIEKRVERQEEIER